MDYTQSPAKVIIVINGAFVISQEAIASFSPPGVAHLFERKTLEGVQRL